MTNSDRESRAVLEEKTDVAIFHVTSVGEVPGTKKVRLLPKEFLRGAGAARTRDVEAGLRLPRSVYFYAGHAGPFGNVAVAFEPELAFQKPGSATPFDTGGVFYEYINLPKGDRREYVSSLIVRDLRQFWKAFDEYVRCHFDDACAYCLGEKPQPCEGGQGHGDFCSGSSCRHAARFADNADRRAWTWEIQMHGDVLVHTSLRAIYMDQPTVEALSQAYEKLPDREWWLATLKKKVQRVSFPVPRNAEIAEAPCLT